MLIASTMVWCRKEIGPMKRKVMIIGIGAGNPDHVTIQALEAMNRVDVFFIPDKGLEKGDLRRLRRLIIDRHVRNRSVRTVEYKVPSRRQETENYEGAVSAWHAKIGETYGRLIQEELIETEIGAFLVWGDPTLYDSTLRILEHLRTKGGFELDYDVIPRHQQRSGAGGAAPGPSQRDWPLCSHNQWSLACGRVSRQCRQRRGPFECRQSAAQRRRRA